MELWLPYFYESLLVKLSEAVNDKGEVLIKHADMFAGQYDLEANADEDEATDAYLKPAVFFEALPYTYQNLGLKTKAIPEFEFLIHCQAEVVGEVDQRTQRAVRNRAHENFRLQLEVERLLQGYNGNQVTDGFAGFNSIMCLGASPYEYRGMSIIQILRFRTRIAIEANTLQFIHLAPPTVPAYPTDEITTQILP